MRSWAKKAVIDSFGTRGAHDNGLSIALHLEWAGHIMGGWEEVLHTPDPDGIITYEDRAGDLNDQGDYVDRFFTPGRQGKFHYGLICHYVELDGDQPLGWANGEYDGHFVVREEGRSSDEVGSTFMHELGHTLGLDFGDFDGIDTWDFDFDDYPSVMNYDAPNDYYGYSTGPDSSTNYDDWGHLDLEEHL